MVKPQSTNHFQGLYLDDILHELFMTDEKVKLEAWNHRWEWENGTAEYFYGDWIYTKNIHPMGRVLMRFKRGHTKGTSGYLFIKDDGEFLWKVSAKIKQIF